MNSEVSVFRRLLTCSCKYCINSTVFNARVSEMAAIVMWPLREAPLFQYTTDNTVSQSLELLMNCITVLQLLSAKDGYQVKL